MAGSTDSSELLAARGASLAWEKMLCSRDARLLTLRADSSSFTIFTAHSREGCFERIDQKPLVISSPLFPPEKKLEWPFARHSSCSPQAEQDR